MGLQARARDRYPLLGNWCAAGGANEKRITMLDVVALVEVSRQVVEERSAAWPGGAARDDRGDRPAARRFADARQAVAAAARRMADRLDPIGAERALAAEHGC